MDNKLSNFLINKKANLKAIVEKLSKTFSFVSILATDSEGKTIAVSNKDVKVTDNSFQERGFVVRVYNGKFYSEYSFSNFDNVPDICSRIIDSVKVDELLEKAIYVKATQYNKIEEEEIKEDFSRMDNFEDINIEEVIDFSKNIINNSMENNEYIISCRIRTNVLKISKMYISNKKEMSQVYSFADCSYAPIVNRDDVYNMNYISESASTLKEAFAKLEKAIDEANKTANDLLDAKHIEPGEYECITTPIVTGLIAHEAFGHGVEMDMFVKNRAKAKDYMGKRVASDIVTMHEGAKPYIDVSSYFFDDEGTLAHDTIEIKDGILQTGVCDALSALKLGIKPTGNGKRESYERKVYSRMTATYFEPRESTVEEMIKSIDYGMLIDGEESGMEDPKNWGIQCICLIGREIKNGKLTGKVFSPIIMTGYVVDLLESISMASNDFALYGGGYCGKGYKEFVKTSIGGPYLKVKVKLG